LMRTFPAGGFPPLSYHDTVRSENSRLARA